MERLSLKSLRRAVIAVVILSALLTAAWYGMHFIPADFGYSVETEFTELPPDDEPLVAWLKSQPGVYHGSTRREPAGERTRLVVMVGMTQNGWYLSPFPDLTTKCDELGYRGRTGPFIDERGGVTQR